MINLENFILYIKQEKKKKSRVISLDCDIETFTTNKYKAIKQRKPTLFHSYPYSIAAAYLIDNELIPRVTIFNTFKELIDICVEHGIKSKTFKLTFHNGNKFDNHFLEHDLIYYYPELLVENIYLSNAIENTNTKALNTLDTEEKNRGVIFEKRVKGANNVELTFYIKGIKFETEDSLLKTNTSIAIMGKKLKDNGHITDDYLKTDYVYDLYDLDEDLPIDMLEDYKAKIFSSLSDDQLIYIKNDVIILCLAKKYYSELFFGFDYSQPTFTTNIKNKYLINDLASFQLLKKIDKYHLRFTDFHFNGLNTYDYFKRFYKGGLNFYNTDFLGKIIDKEGFSIDLNSSYPYVMYAFKLPTYLVDFKEENITFNFNVDYNNDDTMTFFTMPINKANEEIIDKIPSRVVREMIVKYYNVIDGKLYFNSVMLRLLHAIFKIEFNELSLLSYAIFDCEYFGGRDIIAENYYIKTQGKQEYMINMSNPLDITLTDKKNTKQLSKEEVEGAKVLLNGIYGVPALRSHFNLFRRDENGDLYNIENGFENKERNIVFSVGVTAYAFYNLLEPFKYFPDKIDSHFWYCDTDSLYLDKEVLKYLPNNLFHSMNLGSWDIENPSISKFYILNHKKYCYEVDNLVKFRCGGIRKKNFNTNVTFEDFITYQFSKGCKISNTRSIRNEQNTITIYNSYTVLELGHNYQDNYNIESYELFERIKETSKNMLTSTIEDSTLDSDILYIETEYGTISQRDFIPDIEISDNSYSMINLLAEYNTVRNKLM